jgi:hypothetical protein
MTKKIETTNLSIRTAIDEVRDAGGRDLYRVICDMNTCGREVLWSTEPLKWEEATAKLNDLNHAIDRAGFEVCAHFVGLFGGDPDDPRKALVERLRGSGLEAHDPMPDDDPLPDFDNETP